MIEAPVGAACCRHVLRGPGGLYVVQFDDAVRAAADQRFDIQSGLFGELARRR